MTLSGKAERSQVARYCAHRQYRVTKAHAFSSRDVSPQVSQTAPGRLLDQHGFALKDLEGLLEARNFAFAPLFAQRIRLRLLDAHALELLLILEYGIELGLDPRAVRSGLGHC